MLPGVHGDASFVASFHPTAYNISVYQCRFVDFSTSGTPATGQLHSLKHNISQIHVILEERILDA